MNRRASAGTRKSMTQASNNAPGTPRNGSPSSTQNANGGLNINLLFEPTGHLEKDYCAYCEISDKNERDDVLDGIYREELEAIPTAQSLAAYNSYMQSNPDAALLSQLGSGRPTDRGNESGTNMPLSGRDTIETASTNRSPADSRISSAAPSRPKSAADPPAAISATSASDINQPTAVVPIIPAHPLIIRTQLFLRNLSFSLNKRDMQPLTDALPHCTTLTTVKMTGCGLSEYSYKLLIAAIYRSSSVHTLAVDMNPDGFYVDCTVNPKRDKNELSVLLSEFRGAHLKINQQADADERGLVPGADRGGNEGGGNAKKGPAKAPTKTTVGAGAGGGNVNKKVAAQAAQLAEASDMAEKFIMPIPTGWHAALMTGVQVLSLRGNGITDTQLGAICGLLATNTDLLSLSLWGNKITDAGAIELAAALKVNRKLVTINLGHNHIGDAGAAAIASVFLTETVSYTEMLARRTRALAICPTSGMNQPRDAPQHPLLLQQQQMIADGISSPNLTTILTDQNQPALAPGQSTNAIAVAFPAPPITQLFPTFADVAAIGISKMIEYAPVSKLKDLGVAVHEVGGSLKTSAQGKGAARAAPVPEKPARRGEKVATDVPIERPTLAFDRDVIRLHEDPEENPATAQLISQQLTILHSSSSANQQAAALQTIMQSSRYRVPSNTTLVDVNLTHNSNITSDGVKTVTTMLESGEPNAETLYGLLSLATVQSSAGGTAAGTSPNATSPSRGKSVVTPSASRKSLASASPGKSVEISGSGLAMHVSPALTSVSGPSGLSAPASNGSIICQQLTTAVLSSPLAFVLNEVRQYVPSGSHLKKFSMSTSRVEAHLLEQLDSVVAERYRSAHTVATDEEAAEGAEQSMDASQDGHQ